MQLMSGHGYPIGLIEFESSATREYPTNASNLVLLHFFFLSVKTGMCLKGMLYVRKVWVNLCWIWLDVAKKWQALKIGAFHLCVSVRL